MSQCRASLSEFCGRHSLVQWVTVPLSEHRGQTQAATPEASLISVCVFDGHASISDVGHVV